MFCAHCFICVITVPFLPLLHASSRKNMLRVRWFCGSSIHHPSCHNVMKRKKFSWLLSRCKAHGFVWIIASWFTEVKFTFLLSLWCYWCSEAVALYNLLILFLLFGCYLLDVWRPVFEAMIAVCVSDMLTACWKTAPCFASILVMQQEPI